MRRRDQWIQWIRAVERECGTAAYALALLQDQVMRDPSSLKRRGLGHRDFVEVEQNREATYLIRIFAVFENGLREAWTTALGESTHPKMADLLDAWASRCHMPNDRLVEAHRVRVYRNNIVHSHVETVAPMALAEARRFLCRFFSFLPAEW